MMAKHFAFLGILYCYSLFLTDHHVMVTDFPQQQDITPNFSLYEMTSTLENQTVIFLPKRIEVFYFSLIA